MRPSGILDYVVVALAVAAAGAGLASSYEGAAGAVLVLGMALSLRAVLNGAPVRKWVLPRRGHAPRIGPVTGLVATLRSAKQGSYFSQAQIGLVLRSAGSGQNVQELPKEIIEPAESATRLKGDAYMSKLESAVKVLRDD
jgi:hypothetical protein